MPGNNSEETLNWVWVPDKKEVFRKANIVESLENSTVKVKFEDGSEEVVSSNVIGEVNPKKFDKADDIAELTFLNEGSVLYNLQARYKDDLIYTYSGLFLVAINPYTKLGIYSDNYINMYHNVPKTDSKPHIFAETDEAYQNLLSEKKDQSILVTGESGAGKTENTKKIIKYLAAITSKHKTGGDSFEEQIIQANPILEAFGNAQTVRNNNSSRFGKFIKIEFDAKGKIAGAHIDWYLLEKSRVVHHSKHERNYHIFYQLLSGLTDKELDMLGLEKSPSDHSYLKETNFNIPGVDDAKEFKSLRNAFDIMGIKKEQYYEIFKVIAIILHLGNIEFASMKAEQASFKSSIEKLSQLLGVKPKIFSDSILNPSVKAGKEYVKQSRNATQAKFSLDALAKSLYEKLFKYLVDEINKNLDNNGSSSNFIGVLDIAGFEIFHDNSFEQLCINYTNEKLQQFFNHHMFVLEQNEYIKEDINWEFIDFGQDLQQTIDLIEKKSNPVGIFSILDEECIVPKSTDESFFEKLNQYCNKESSKFKPSKFNNKFTLNHYAGDVEYSIEGWINKNRDPLANSVLEMLSGSGNKFISGLYQTEDDQKSGSSFRTVSQKHKEQLNDLITLLSQTHPHFVRCIIPNHKKKPQIFDKRLVLEQLKCNGVLEGIRIVRSGFPNRIFFKEFYDRYRVLAPKANFTSNLKTNCQMILSDIKLDEEIYRVGSTKVFFKAGVLADLELKRDQIIKVTFSEFKAICKGVLKRRAINKQLLKVQASQVIADAFRSYNKFNENEWFSLYANLKPLLESSQQVNKTRQINEQVRSLEKKVADLEAEKTDIVDQLSEKVKSLELTETAHKELEAKFKSRAANITELEKERNELVQFKEGLDAKLKTHIIDLTKALEQIKALDNEKLNLNAKALEYEQSATKSASEIKQLKALIKQKDSDIVALNDTISKSNNELQETLATLSAKNTVANTQLEKLTNENKTLNETLKTFEENSNVNRLKELLSKQVYQIKQLQSEREQLKKSQTATSSELFDIQTKYKQLEHEAKEAKEFLQRKISDEIAFNKGKQSYENEINALKVEINELDSNLKKEKESKIPLINEIKELKADNESLQNDRKISDVRSAQGAFRTKSLNAGLDPEIERMRDDKELLIKEYARMKLQLNESSAMLKKETIEKTRLKADLKLLHTRLASETFDRQQLKIKLNRIRESLANGETPIFEEKETELIHQNNQLQEEIKLLKVDLDLERKASKRVSSEAPKPALRESSNLYRSPLLSNDLDNYKAKFEESQAKVRLLERKITQESLVGNALALNTSLGTSEQDLIRVYQETSKALLSTRQEYSDAKIEIVKLNKMIDGFKDTIAHYKTKDVEALSYQLAREELTKSQMKLQAIESKNQQLSESVKLYKSRADEYFSKLENAEVAVRNSRHSEKFSIQRLNEANDSIEELKKEIEVGEASIVKLNSTVSQLKGEIETKEAELSKMYSSTRFLQEEVHLYQERLERETRVLKNKYESQVSKLNEELTKSLREETNLRKSLGSLEVEYNRLKEQKDQEIKELIKAKTHLTRIYNDLKEENESVVAAQKDLEIKLRSLMKQITTLNESVDSLITERDNLQVDKRNLEERVKVLSSEYSKFDNEREINGSTISGLNKSINKYQEEIENLNMEIKKINASKEKLNSIIDDEKQKNVIFVEENQSLGKYAESLKGRISELEEKIEALSNDEIWVDRLSKLERALKSETDLKLQSEKSKSVLERSVDELQEQVNNQHKKINELGDMNTKYNLKISELFNAINKWQSADSQSKLIIKRSEREIRHLQEHSMELEKEVNEWKEKFDSISSKKRNLPTSEIFI